MDLTRDDQRRTARALIDIVNVFRSVDRNITVGAMLTFLMVAEVERASMAELKTRLGVSLAAMSRNIGYLTERSRQGRPGLALLRRVEVKGRRGRALELTAGGELLVRVLRERMAKVSGNRDVLGGATY